MFRNFFLEKVYSRKPRILKYSKNTLVYKILQYSYNNTRYYKKLIDDIGGFPDSESKTFSLLEKIPVLTKELIRENEEMLIASQKRSGLHWNTSGGSSGKPIRILQDNLYLQSSRYIVYNQKTKTGFIWGLPLIKVWGDEREILGQNRSLRDILINRIKKQTVLNSFKLTSENKLQILKYISNNCSGIVVGYVQSIYQIALFAKEMKVKINSPRSIIVSAGTLYPFMREKIKKVFSSDLYNRYGSREVGPIAMSGPNQDSLYITKGCWVEVLDEADKPVPFGIEGEIVITSLINYAMPLIRYKIGDRGSLEAVEKDGKIDIRIKKLTGRSVDLFTTQDGNKVDGEFFTHLMYFRDWVKEFQFVQKNYNSIVLSVVVKYEPSNEEINEIELGVKAAMSKKCTLSVKYVDKIPNPKSGKFRFTISEV